MHRYALNVSLRALHEASVISELSTQTVENRAARISETTQISMPGTPTQPDLAVERDTPSKEAISMADMALTNRRLCERLRLIKERSIEKEKEVHATCDVG